jgi:hypothetical protein
MLNWASDLAARGRRSALPTGFLLILVACSGPGSPFPGGGTVRDVDGQLAVGCPQGWEFDDRKYSGAVLLRPRGYEPPIDGFSFAVSAGLLQENEFLSGTTEPRDANAFIDRLSEELGGIPIAKREVGEFEGNPAGWFRFKVPPHAVESGIAVDAWWAILLGTDGWLVYRIDNHDPDIPRDAVDEVIRGFEPLTDERVAPAGSGPRESRFSPCP